VGELSFFAVILASVLYGALRVAVRHVPVAWPEILATFVATVAAVAIMNGGVGRYGTALGAIGNLAALAVALSPALLLPTALANKLARDNESTFRIVGMTLLSGVLLVWTVPFLFLFVACAFGSECI
jgi:hypothetical protein